MIFITKTNAAARKTLFALCCLIFAYGMQQASAQCTPEGDQTSFGNDQWIGYVYTNYDASGNPPADPFSGTYRGYVTQPATFTQNLGDGAISGDNLCGTYNDNFAVRYKMSKELPVGWYHFSTAGDDGFRLSLDGGNTFPSNLQVWSNHGNVGASTDYFHPGGVMNFVLEYYENGGGSYLDFNYYYRNCTATAPTEITGNNVVYACTPTTTLTANGGIHGNGSRYEWGTGTVAGQNIIPNQEGQNITVTLTAPTTYWVRRVAAYECSETTSAVYYFVDLQSSTPGDINTFGDNVWNVYTKKIDPNQNDAETYKGYYIDDAIAFNTEDYFDQNNENPSNADTWNGCTFTGTDHFAIYAKRQGFPCGEYTLSVNKWDDEIWVYIDDMTTPVFHYNGYSGGAPNVPFSLGTMLLNEDTKIFVHMREAGGAANAYLKITPLTVAPSAINATAEVVCPGDNVTLTATGGATGAQGVYQWGTGAVGENIIAGATTATILVSPDADTNYWVRISKPECGGSYTDAAVKTIAMQTNQWVGPANSSWHVAENWSCGKVPTLGQPVVIPTATHQPAITAQAFAKSLSVSSGSSVTIATGGTLTIANALNVASDATFTIQDNGALVQVNEAANSGIIHQTKKSNALYRLDYTLWSAPVSGTQTLHTFSPLTLSNRYYEYKYDTNSANSTLNAYWAVDATQTTWATAKSFLIRMPNSSDATGFNDGTAAIPFSGEFEGTPNNGTITRKLELEGNRYTAIGNPYASPVSIEDFFAANSTVLEEGTGIWLWRKRNNSQNSSYATVTNAGFTANPATGGGNEQADFYSGELSTWLIAQGQGFFVKTKETLTAADNHSIVFNNAMRRGMQGATQAFFRSAQSQKARVWLNLTSADQASQTLIAYTPDATTGIDYALDGKTFDASSLSFYSVTPTMNLAIQARPEFEATDIVPMGYKAVTAGEHTISIDHVDGQFTNGQEIYVRDNAEGITRKLNDHPYIFTTEAGTFENRFEILYQNSALGTNNPELTANVVVYQNENGINISAVNGIESVQVYDMLGRSIFAKQGINNASFATGSLPVAHEALIVKVKLSNGAETTKKVVL